MVTVGEENRMKESGGFVRRVAAFMLLPAFWALVIGLGTEEPSKAQWTSPIATTPPDFSSGMMGLAARQTARLNVVNIGVVGASPLPCVLAIAFVDSNSKVLKQTFVSLGSGKAAFLELSLTDIGSSDRTAIRGIGYNPLLTPGSAIPQPLSCNLLPTLELFDVDTGRTLAILGDFAKASTSVSPLVQ
jgi:hypothetical protein